MAELSKVKMAKIDMKIPPDMDIEEDDFKLKLFMMKSMSKEEVIDRYFHRFNDLQHKFIGSVLFNIILSKEVAITLC